MLLGNMQLLLKLFYKKMMNPALRYYGIASCVALLYVLNFIEQRFHQHQFFRTGFFINFSAIMNAIKTAQQ